MTFVHTKKGRIIEFPHKNKNFIKYLGLKSIALIIDYILIIIIQVILVMMTNLSWLLLGLITTLYFFSYSTITSLIWGRTVGLMITKLTILNCTGFLTSKADIIGRSALISIYAFPIVGQALMITNILTAYFWKGVTLIDFLTRTVIITKMTHLILQKEESKMIRKLAKEEKERYDL